MAHGVAAVAAGIATPASGGRAPDLQSASGGRAPELQRERRSMEPENDVSPRISVRIQIESRTLHAYETMIGSGLS